MSFTATMNTTPATIKLDNTNQDDENLVEEFAKRLSFEGTEAPAPIKRASRSSLLFFQNETGRRSSQVSTTADRRTRNSFIGLDGKVQDDYIAKRANINKPTNKLEDIPVLADLTKAESITKVDGNVLAQLFFSGYARLQANVELLNRINRFPIADADTGANMKVCLKLPCRNLILDPSPSVLRVASNMAADVLLNGQGNSGTILSHFYVSLAEEIRDIENTECHEALTINEFAACLVRVGGKMADSVPNPVEGTLLSVARDSCEGLAGKDFSNLKELIDTWKDIAEVELKATPDKLIVDGVKVLKKDGVVDSGAQGFFYTVEGMWLASRDELPEATDPNLFKTSVNTNDGQENLADIIDDHSICDTKYQFCTEAVILLKDGVTKDEVMEKIESECQETTGSCSCDSKGALGDSLACVSGPAKEGGNMLKLHIHTNEPQRFFDILKPYSKDPIFKKEKVEDMKLQSETAHGSSTETAGVEDSVDNAKFTMIGLSSVCLPSTVLAENAELLHSFPMFVVPADTNEPIDVRFASSAETVQTLNKQRNPATAVRMTTATSTPMQMKIELLSALSKGKPVLCMVFSLNKKVSAFGRNVLLAIDMLEPEQKAMVKVFVHGWFHDGLFLLEAIKCARRGGTIDEALAICEDLAQRTYNKVSFMNAELFRKLKAWRPAMFPDGFVIPEGHYSISGPPAGVRPDGVAVEKRVPLSMAPIGMGSSMDDAFEKAAKHIKSGLKPGDKVGNILVPCVGRPDFGHILVRKLEEEGIEIEGNPFVYSEGMLGVVMGSWGSVGIQYQIIEA